ncbi:MAG: helix-turn-helix transcriptional regulator [Bacteroidota bacterium]
MIKVRPRNNINNILKSKGLRRKDLYYMLESEFGKSISITEISNICNNRWNDLKTSNVTMFCRVLDVTPNDLLINPYTENGKWQTTY